MRAGLRRLFSLRAAMSWSRAGRRYAGVGMAVGLGWWVFGVEVVSGAVVPPEGARDHWAFRPLGEWVVPAVGRGDWVRTEIDRFVLARLEREGVAPAELASPRELVRRMSFDLTGLPPTGDEVEAFANEAAVDREAAVGRLIDRLLSSPRYGERWGRHWLDVARYADTKGYVYGREERKFVHAPAYRDWVIRALNEDLPYDRFLLLQLAADQVVPADSPDLAAMGFLTGGRRFIGVTHDIIDDRIDVVTRGTMGLTVSCARCHDHKYDPIPTADYYSLYGIFRASHERLVPLAGLDDGVLAGKQKELAETMATRREEAAVRLRARVGDYLAAQFELGKYPEEGFDQIIPVEDLIPASVRRWRDFLRMNAGGGHPIFGPWTALSGLDEAGWAGAAEAILTRVLAEPGLNPLVKKVLASGPDTRAALVGCYQRVVDEAESQPDEPGAAEVRAFLRDAQSPTVVPDTAIVNNEMFFPTAVIEAMWRLQGDVDRRLIEMGVPAALILEDGERALNPRVFIRGLPANLGEEVPRQFLEVLAGPTRQPFSAGSGRLELARAVTSVDNPLVARVMVNRLWQHHFGTGLVKTPSDFGLRAGEPSHPELLDWLARKLMAGGWSLKAMHRLMMTSTVYQLAAGSEEAVAGGKENLLGAGTAARRLDFEQLRDGMLRVAGELDETMGGRPQNLLNGSNVRRTVYGEVDRQFLPGVLRTFDFANPDLHVAVRHETTVPQQALYFLNGSFAAARARALAALVDGLAEDERVQRLYRMVYQRTAGDGEVAAALRFVQAAGDEAVPEPAARSTAWQHGTGAYDETTQRVAAFRLLPHAAGGAWQGAAAWPGGETGWAQLTADGGHPGNTRAQAVVRRWVAPVAGQAVISGVLRHEPTAGDGVRGWIISSRHGVLREARVHAAEAGMEAGPIEVEVGDTLDFVVDVADGLDSDQFVWAPGVAMGDGRWAAADGFPATGPGPDYLQPWEQYAQVLLLSNEFAFVD